MVRGLDHVQVVLDDDDRVALVHQQVEHVQQPARVFEVEPRRRLVQDVERPAGAAAGQLPGQLHPLRLAAAEGRRRLPQLHVPEAHVLQRAQLRRRGRHVLQQLEGLIHRQRQHVGDGRAAVGDFQRLPVVAAPLALPARHVDVRQEVHLDGEEPVPPARFAAPALHVEREAARPVPPRAGLGPHRVQLADEREESRVGGGVGPRRAAYRRLVYPDHLVEQLDAFDRGVRPGLGARPVQRAGQRAVEDVVHQGRLAGPADPGDGGQHAQRDRGVDVLQVVGPRAADHDRPVARGTAGRRDRNRALALQVQPGQRFSAVRRQRRRGPLEDHPPPVLPRSRPEVDHVVRRADGLLVVLDHHHRVAEVAQPLQRGQQQPVVALVQPDGRFVEHVEHAGQTGPDLRGQPDPLRLPARQGRRAPGQRQVAHAHVAQEPHSVPDLAQHAPGQARLALAEPQPLDHRQRLGHRHVHVVRDRASLHLHGAALGTQPPAAARGARPQRAVGLQGLLLRPGPLVVAAPQVGDDALEVLAERIGAPDPGAPAAGPGRGAAPVPAAVGSEEQQFPVPPRQPAERRVEIDAEAARQARQRPLDELPVAAGPGLDGPAGQGQGIVGDDPRGIEVLHGAEPVAGGTGAVRRVEREGPRRHLRDADAALDAGHAPREQPVAPAQRVDDHDVVGQGQGELDRLGEPPLGPAAHDEPVHHRLDPVVPPPIQLRLVFDRAHLAVDPHARQSPRPERGQLLPELALAAAHDGREDVHPLDRGLAHDRLDDALHRLRRDLPAARRAMRRADVGEQQAQVVVDLGDGADRRARVRPGRALLDGDGGRQAVDLIDVGLLDLLEELAGVGGQRLDVTPLAFRVEGVERQRRLAGTGKAGYDDQPVARNADVDVLQVVDARSADVDPVVRHGIVNPLDESPNPSC